MSGILPGVCMFTLNIVRGDIFIQSVPLQTLTNGCEFSRSFPYNILDIPPPLSQDVAEKSSNPLQP